MNYYCNYTDLAEDNVTLSITDNGYLGIGGVLSGNLTFPISFRTPPRGPAPVRTDINMTAG
jgi:hypothetical protein